MATAVPWTNPEFDQLLERKIGSDWERRFETKWGSDWDQPCVQELSSELGSGWQDYPEQATDVLANKLDTTQATPGVGRPATEATAAALGPDSEVNLDFSRYPWLNTFNDADSFASWLTRIGMPAEDSEAIINSGGPSKGGQTGEHDQDRIVDVDFSRYQWLNTLTEASSFESWLTRIGLPAEDTRMIINAQGANVTEENK